MMRMGLNWGQHIQPKQPERKDNSLLSYALCGFISNIAPDAKGWWYSEDNSIFVVEWGWSSEGSIELCAAGWGKDCEWARVELETQQGEGNDECGIRGLAGGIRDLLEFGFSPDYMVRCWLSWAPWGADQARTNTYFLFL